MFVLTNVVGGFVHAREPKHYYYYYYYSNYYYCYCRRHTDPARPGLT